MGVTPWAEAVTAAWAVGRDAAPAPVRVALPDADGRVLAEPLAARTDLPAFPSSSVDGWAVRGDGPWRVTGRVLAGAEPPPLAADGECVEIATGAMVPAGTTAILRVEDSTTGSDGRVSGTPRAKPEWRPAGEEAAAGEQLAPAGTAVTPALVGLAAAGGYDDLAVRPAPRAAVLVFGDELLAAGAPGGGRVRDALGPQLPGWLRRLGATVDGPVPGPGVDTLAAHVSAISSAVDKGADLVCTTGGTMHGPVDHLHPALAELGAAYVVDTVAVRPGFPMLLATVPAPGGRTAAVAGLPGNPQSAVVALVTLVAPLLAGWSGRPVPPRPAYPRVRLGAPVPGRGEHTHLALVRRDPDSGLAYPLRHAGSAMLRGLAGAVGFAVIAPGTEGSAGDEVPLLPLPLLPGELP
ncbi:MAG: molybdopterin molybdenumtransferase MoeA [Micromonosporaceae bacterium]|nr:molybdopterin molybdenumtransferase MoeA [Micromonosporaceae bacterium]